MNHKLRVLIRLDVNDASAVVAVAGCLTTDSFRALLPVIRRTRSLAGGIGVDIDLSDAMHLEPEAVEALRISIAEEMLTPGAPPVTVSCPDAMPTCPALAYSHHGELQAAS